MNEIVQLYEVINISYNIHVQFLKKKKKQV